MDLAQIRQLCATDMDSVNETIQQQLSSDVALINQLGFYIINAGGKRLRPMLTVLAARALGYDGDKHVRLATLVEFIHTSTLLHDDVVDESTLRRGRETANALFGNQASVLVGDFLYTRAFQLMVALDSMKVMQVLADATNVIAEGEVMQLMNCNDPETTEARYMKVIYSKTAKLFEAATGLSAVISGQPELEDAMSDYGKYLGTAFQLIDDLLDYEADADELGKNLGDDLAEGKPTLPLLHAMHNGNAEESAMIRQAIEQGDGRDKLELVQGCMRRLGSLDYTYQRALEESDKAISALAAIPDSPYKEALIGLAKVAVERKS
ncbi:octaprenyl diphosphate synthase [Gallaecimonas pentaromativorans]|uniref:Octaprenyl diphosphate synthase n=1 Tax=Gallaecimonas pentaromativorans TaxID=584787 RepID=A0A3N1PRR6_9GAMM|nr:octaprenyl diphosphate synthase [Gallaecimonas pentaromativorans]MED5523538.1 octaprenyl diphosphate synthase [Pseudomonadota bacterium]ROQ30728.1 octaprenyl-diphosphate synthase [Gallaecimonas pentaromativorans]